MANNYLVNHLTIQLYCSNSTRYNVYMSQWGPKLIPISKLTSAFLLEQIELTVQAITSYQLM